MKHDDISIYIGSKIQEYRNQLGITQQELGDLIGLSRTSVMNIESGRHGVTNDNLFFLCGLFGCQVSNLFPPIEAVNIEFGEKEIRVKKTIRTIKIKKQTK